MTEDEVQAAIGDLDASGLDDRTVAALRLVDVLTGPEPAVSDALHEELRRHFDDDEILELAVALSVASGWQRFIEAFGIRPDSLGTAPLGFTPRLPGPANGGA
jgi:alkylhydroperoxidase family enzyme